jgi:glyoxylase-like metal-dependent hydrolase (beta-lactamase superfamily II)
VLVTHIHLDHSGAAGWWGQQGARIYVHPMGAPHIVDPRRLWESASRIYGEEMEAVVGQRVAGSGRAGDHRCADGEQIEAAGLTLTAIDTPGHAGHHHTYRLGDVGFTGDAAGVRVPGSDWVSLPAPPPEFNRELWWKTLDRLEAERFQRHLPDPLRPCRGCGLPAYRDARRAGRCEHVRAGAHGCRHGARRSAQRLYQVGTAKERISRGMSDEDFARYEAANPLFMSVDGLMRYWRKQAAAESAG